MIYLTQTTQEQSIYFPIPRIVTGQLRIIIASTDSRKMVYDAAADYETAGNYIHTSIQFEEEPELGGYEYALIVGGSELTRGVARIGNMWIPSEYEEQFEIKQYV